MIDWGGNSSIVQKRKGMKTLILGLGNPILSDDGVGVRVAEELKNRIDRHEVTVAEASIGGLGLLDLLDGYDRAIIIDAIQTAGGEAGRIYQLRLDALEITRHVTSPHDVNFATALALGNKLGLSLPQHIVIFAIEAADVITFGEECTPEVKRAIPICVKRVINELRREPEIEKKLIQGDLVRG